MLQEINFRDHINLPVRSPFDARTLLSSYILYTLFLIVIQIIGMSFKYPEERKLSTAQENLQLLTPQLEASKRTLFVMLGEVHGEASPCKIKFSHYLEAFSQASFSGMWLTNFSLLQKGKVIQIQGVAARAIDANQFMQALKKNPFFANYKFEMTQLTSVSLAEQYQFTISGKVEA